MITEKDPREEEFLATIKAAERQRALFPFVLLGILILYIWLAGGDIFERPTLETTYPMVIIFGLIYVGTEVTTVRILMYKAEYRDWLKEFRSEKWKDNKNG